MKLTVVEELCVGHGRCYALAPEVYAPDAEGYNAARGMELEVLEQHQDQARRGLRGCPEHAIRTVKEQEHVA